MATKEQNTKRHKEWRHKNPDKARAINLKRRYGITIDQYSHMLVGQNNVCAICKRGETGRSNAKNLIVDHDHSTGLVRGLLCDLCNKGLAYFGDNETFLKNAINYICTSVKRSKNG